MNLLFITISDTLTSQIADISPESPCGEKHFQISPAALYNTGTAELHVGRPDFR